MKLFFIPNKASVEPPPDQQQHTPRPREVLQSCSSRRPASADLYAALKLIIQAKRKMPAEGMRPSVPIFAVVVSSKSSCR